jgi:hypothetical protein
MGKKKQDTVQDIMDRIQEELDVLRDKVNDLENNQCEGYNFGFCNSEAVTDALSCEYPAATAASVPFILPSFVTNS